MRLDDAGPRTWLFATAGAWALLAWLLALVGMGGRVEPLPEDPALLQALPSARPSPPLRLGPFDQYDAIAGRPLFSEDRKLHPFFLEGEGESAEGNPFDYVLTSVLISPQLEMAILQPAEGGRSVRVKLDEAPESHPGWRLVSLDRRSAVFEGPEGPRTLQLRVYDGVGGERPTEVAAASDPRIPITPPPVVERAPPATKRSDDAAAPTEPPAEDGEPTGFSDEMTEAAQMEAIRERIQARREQLRNKQKSQPPADSP